MNLETHLLMIFNDLSSNFCSKKYTFGCFVGEEGNKCVFEVWSRWVLS